MQIPFFSKHILPLFAITLITTGCTLSKENYTSGIIGCPAKEVKILSETIGWNANSWDAECRGKLFNCTYVTGGRVICTETIPESNVIKAK